MVTGDERDVGARQTDLASVDPAGSARADGGGGGADDVSVDSRDTDGTPDADRTPDTDDTDSATLVLPWYYSWWRVALVAMAATLFVVAGVIAIASDDAPGPESVDVGFLQDMRSHHDQAVLMSLIYLNRPDTDPGLYTMATEVLLSQQMEIGIFVEVLRSFGAAEENSTGVAMAWMGAPVPLDAMPGMASDESLDQLRQSSGHDADQLFTDLMIAHHEGGIHMADYAIQEAETERVRDIADAVARNQTSEIAELTAALERSTAA